MNLLKVLKHALIKDNHYVSEADTFLQTFDRKNPRRSTSQLKEIEKHRDIFARDTANKIDWS